MTALGTTGEAALVYVVGVPVSIDWLDVGERAVLSSVCATRRDGSTRVRLFGGEAIGSPDLSPRGDLVFVRYVGGASLLMLKKADSRTAVELVSVQKTIDLRPAWSPDGARIAFGDGDLEVVDPASGARTVVAAGGGDPAWSPDGRRLAFVRGGQVWTAQADGSNVVDVGAGEDPSWSPAGDQFAVDRRLDATHWQLARFPVGGGPAVALAPVTAGAAPRPTWSPDGRFVAFTAESSAPPSANGDTAQYDVFVVSPEGGVPENVTNSAVSEGGARWSTTVGVPPAQTGGCGGLSGSAQGDHLAGSNAGDTIFGLAGDDQIAAAAGADLIFGNSGADTLLGGPGDDQIEGDDYGGRPYRDTLEGGAGNDIVRGEGGDDAIDGGTGHDVLGTQSSVSSTERPPGPGEAGNDRMWGRAGNDWLYGGPGRDRLDGGTGSDWVDGGPGNDRVTGGHGNDHLFGGLGNDTIDARDGQRDTISCGPGRDTVYEDKLDSVATDCERVLRAR